MLRIPRPTFEPNGVIAVDIDGTLVIDGRPNSPLIEWIKAKQAEGRQMVLWSSRGTQYAIDTAQRLGITHLFSVIVGKPCAIVDDKGWSWTRFARVLTPSVNQPCESDSR